MWRLGLSAALLASACQYDRPPDVMAIDAREVDAVDAPPPCTPSTIVCDDAASVYTECDAGGSVVRQLTCPLGCATDTEQCLDIDPHNGLAMYLDMVASPPDVVLVGPATLDPMTGLIFDGGRSIDVPTFVSADGIRVFVVNSLTVQGAVAVAPSANLSHPIAVVSRGDIVIRGVVDVSASRDLAGPGGWPGTDPQHAQGANCIGRPVFAGPPSPGGGGGGGAVAGAPGGGTNMVAGGVPGDAQPEVDPLNGGCAGGAILAVGEAYGGGGGGGLQLASRTEIRIEGNGAIDASGGGGAPGGLNVGGTGGGAGGDVVLEAPQVVLTGNSAVVSTKGGGGGGASSASTLAGYGADGGLAAAAAPGGTSPIGNLGGSGGTETPPLGGADALGGGQSGGGGGGAAGTVLAGTAAGVLVPANGAAVRGRRQDELLRTRRIP